MAETGTAIHVAGRNPQTLAELGWRIRRLSSPTNSGARPWLPCDEMQQYAAAHESGDKIVSGNGADISPDRYNVVTLEFYSTMNYSSMICGAACKYSRRGA